MNKECRPCELGMGEFRKQELEMIKEFGFTTRYVFDDDKCPHGTNIVTRGIEQTFNHPNFQICFPIKPEIGHLLLWELVHKLEVGEIFKAGVEYHDIMANGYVTKFINAIENERPVLRLVIPDKDGTYGKSPYKEQFTMLDNSNGLSDKTVNELFAQSDDFNLISELLILHAEYGKK